MLQSEYMAGHQISVHTWSHSALTTLTNEQIVAELGWTKKVIKDTIGVTPNTFRPPCEFFFFVNQPGARADIAQTETLTTVSDTLQLGWA